MNVAAVREAYRASEAGEVGPEVFERTSLAYAKGHSEAASEAADLYCAMGADGSHLKPIGDKDFVGGLFELALRQPVTSQVARVTSMAVGVAALPKADLGRMSDDDRYTLLHAAAQLCQSFAADLAKGIADDYRRPNRMGIGPFGWMVVLSILGTLAFIIL